MADSKHPRNEHPSTAVLTRGFDPRLSVWSARPAVFRTSTYVFPTPEAAERAFDITSGREQLQPGENSYLIYSRFNHPNAEILEDQMVPIEENAEWALVFNSGMAAIMTALLSVLKPGDSIVYTMPLYGGTMNMMHQLMEPLGIHTRAVAAGHSEELDEAILGTPNLRAVLIETPANPTMRMTDIRRATLTAARLDPKPVVMVDNTFLGPVFQHPLTLGADLVIYSATKYLGGFSDLLAGMVLGRDAELRKGMFGHRGMFGNILQPDECWILDGRLPTVSLRMNRQSKNAQRIAEALHGHKLLSRVIYPTLFTDPEQKRIFAKQCDFPGGMFCIEFAGGKEPAFEFLRHLRITRNAVSLGGVESLTCHPKSTTHSAMSPQELEESGVTDGLVRISVGVEDWRDLLADFEQALSAVAER